MPSVFITNEYRDNGFGSYPGMKEIEPVAATGEPIQDGLLRYYNTIAPLADANVEKRLEAEPFEWPCIGSPP